MATKTKLTYEEWMREVDREVQNLVGLSASDLADYAYRDAYDAGSSPKSVAKRAIRADMGGVDY